MKLSEIIADLQRKLETQGDVDFGGYTIVPVKTVASPPAERQERPERSNEEFIDTPLYQQRLAICETCPELTRVKIPMTSTIVRQCLKCGCVMELKSRFKIFSCPLGKW